MRNKIIFILTGLVMLLIFYCSSHVKIVNVKAEPTIFRRGETGKLFVELSGARSKVGYVQGIASEFQDYSVSLNDDGKMGDEKADDGVWTFEIPVPYDAPLGRYNLDIIVKNKKGDVIQLKEAEYSNKIVVEIR